MAHRYKVVREHLNDLGYYQPLVTEGIPLVEKLLSDLIQTTSSLRHYKHLAQKAIEEKDRFQCDIEPYKCDNAKLVKQCNDLHLEFMKFRENANENQKELKKTIRKLEKENSELQSKLLHIDIRNQKKFLSTKSPKEVGTKYPKSNVTTRKTEKTYDKYHLDLEENMNFLKQEITEQKEQLKTFKHQLANRDKEIKRLTSLLEGGRPMDAINKDCCYKNVDSRLTQLSNEVVSLEKEKENLQTKLKEAIDRQHEAMKRALHLADRNKQLEKELRDIDHMALAVEADCNCTVKQNKEKVKEVNVCLDEALSKISDLERQLVDMRHKKKDLESDLDVVKVEKDNLKDILDNTIEEKKRMNDRINQFTIIEHDLNVEIDRLTQMSALQKRKIAELEGKLLSKQYAAKKNELSEKIKYVPPSPVKSSRKSPVRDNKNQQRDEPSVCVHDRCIAEHCAKYHGIGSSIPNAEFNTVTLDRIRGERDYYCREYQRLRDQMNNLPEQPENCLELRRKLNEKEQLLSTLQEENRDMARQKHELMFKLEELEERNRWCGVSGENGGTSPKEIIKRLERERDIAKSDIIRLEEEKDAMHARIKVATETQMSEHARLEKLLMESEDRIRQLEAERRDMTMNQGSRRATINSLEDQCQGLKDQLKSTQNEIDHVRALYSQLKVLQEQTDKALADSQGQLIQAERELSIAQSRIKELERDKSNLIQEITLLKDDIVMLRGNLVKLDQEKDNLLITVDEKTERLAILEEELRGKDNQCVMYNTALNDLEKKLDVVVDENGSKDATLRNTNREVERLRRENESLKNMKENVLSENRRLQDELTTLIADCHNSSQNLNTSQKEVEDLKRQLQSYVSEVKTIEELLDQKERERNEMLENFRSLSHEATILENNNHTLETEATEKRIKLQLAEGKIEDLQQQINTQNSLICGYENQISSLTSEVANLERKLREQTDMRCMIESDLNAARDLCTKLNMQKDTMMNETGDKDARLNQMQRDLDRLRKDNDKLMDNMQKDRATIRSLEDLLKQAREESVEHRIKSQEFHSENQLLNSKICELQAKLELQTEKVEHLKVQSVDYFKQIQKLQNEIASVRLERTHERELDYYPSL